MTRLCVCGNNAKPLIDGEKSFLYCQLTPQTLLVCTYYCIVFIPLFGLEICKL
jgi:hypothetical protein